MTTDLPDDLLAFLRAGRELDYDAETSEIGHITLKREADLTRSTIEAFPGCQSIIDDPYEELDGVYQVEVYDLVAETKYYASEGFLCWIVALERFGCIDSEHGDVITFPGVTWTDIVTTPLTYLDAQWREDEVGERVLPWLHFPFQFNELDAQIRPYGSRCPVHDAPVTVQQTGKPLLFDTLRRREPDDWFEHFQTAFPYSGVPVTDDELLCCPECRAGEDAWLQRTVDSIPPADAVPNSAGWIQCPECGIRFSRVDPNAFADGFHLSCGQKIDIVQ